MHFTNLLIIMLVALVAPLIVNALPALRVLSPVLEIVAGIVIGPSVLGWVAVDAPVEVLALVGLAFLLFLAGLEIDVHRLCGRQLILALTGFVVSFAIVVGVALLLAAGGFASAPLLVGLALVVALLEVALIRAGRSARADRVFRMLMDTTAQIRIRFAMLLLIAFLALAQGLGFEAILGAFLAGAVLRLIDADAATVYPHTELKLDAIGYGFLIPVFFVTSGVMFDAQALFASPSPLLQVPLLLAALIAAGLVSVLLFPAIALGMMRGAPPDDRPVAPAVREQASA